MRASTELLIALAAASVLAWQGYQLATATIVAQIQANQRATQFEQALRACEQR